MLKRLLSTLVLVTFSIAAQNQALEEDLEGIRALLLHNDGETIGNFFSNKTTIKEGELNQLDESLDQLDGLAKQKREAKESTYLNDEPTNEEDDDAATNDDVKMAMSKVEIPMKSGSPAFSIKAEKVYILYPSMFQDPNIFGRFSIPQNINLDPLPDKSVSKTSEAQSPVVYPMSNNYNPYATDPTYNNPMGGRRMAREAGDKSPKQSSPKGGEDKKRNVETHLTGTIVVLNQDVNENNRKESY